MQVEWDPNKADINLQKHGIHFSDAEAVLFDPNALSFEDTTAQGEQRLLQSGWIVSAVASCGLHRARR